MVLLTSGQVSVVLSTVIVAVFTFLLFISGYVLQQRTVQSLQTVIRPHAPVPRHGEPLPHAVHINPSKKLSRPFGSLRDRIKLQNQLSAEDEVFDWNKLAYAQLVRDHSDVCNALIFFADLSRSRSPVPRLLLFPRSWIEKDNEDVQDPLLETSLRLLKKASRRYRVILVPIDPVGGNSDHSNPQYSLASLFSLAQYERVLSFPPPGLILESKILDSILAFSEVSTISTYPALNVTSSSLLLVKPCTSTFKSLTKVHASSSVADTDLLSRFFPSPAPLLSESDSEVYTTISSVRTAEQFNASVFLAETAFVLFEDGELPGPEYDVPYTSIVKMRPTGNDDQAFLWEKMYSTFKDRRYGVCGLDLEVWPPPKSSEAEDNRLEELKLSVDDVNL